MKSEPIKMMEYNGAMPCKKCGFGYGLHSAGNDYCPEDKHESGRFKTDQKFEVDPRFLHYSDMTLRDLFAAFALCGMISNPGEFAIAYKSGKFFNDCFEVADEMLKARNRKSKV